MHLTLQTLLQWSCHYWTIVSDVITTTSTKRKCRPSVDGDSILVEAQFALGNAALYNNDPTVALEHFSQVKTPQAAWNQAQVGMYGNPACTGCVWNQTCMGRVWNQACMGCVWNQACMGRVWNQARMGCVWNQARMGCVWNQAHMGCVWNQAYMGCVWNQARMGCVRNQACIYWCRNCFMNAWQKFGCQMDSVLLLRVCC